MSHNCWIDSCDQCDMPDCSCDCRACGRRVSETISAALPPKGRHARSV